MTIDIRALVSCNLGPVISGGISDDHLQGTGLIRTRGEVVLQGAHGCSFGTAVQIATTGPGGSSAIPRQLYVIGSFADPLKRQTTVSLGCKLTLAENIRLNKIVTPADDPQNEGIPCSEFGKVPLNITLEYIAQECAQGMGFVGSSFGLVGSISAGSFDFSSGYFNILSDLLYSQCKVAYVNAGRLAVVDIRNPSGGVGIGVDDIIDLSPVGSGDIPASTIVVNYSYNRFKQPDAEDFDLAAYEKRNWERDETIGEPQFIYIRNKDGDLVYTASYSPRSVTETKYDRFDRAIQRIETSTTHAAAVNSAYFADLIENGETPRYTGGQSLTSKTVTEFIYKYSEDQLWEPPYEAAPCSYWYSARRRRFDENEDNQQIGQIVTNYCTGLEMCGSMYLPGYVFVDGSILHPGTDLIVTERRTISYETDTESGITKTITTHDKSNMLTQPGQQGLALMAEEIENAGAALSLMLSGAELTRVGVEVATHYDRNYGLQKRPSAADRTKTAYYKDPRVSESKSTFIVGGEGISSTTTYSMPYAPDDEISIVSTGVGPTIYNVIPSRAEELAQNFGRVQQLLAFGHRFGVSAQIAGRAAPSYPAEGCSLAIGGGSGAGLANGQSWTFDSNGFIANVDILYLGNSGSSSGDYRTPAAWFPVQPGVTRLPGAPTVTTNANPHPANTIPTPENFDPVSPEPSFWASLPTDAPPIYKNEVAFDIIVPPYAQELTYVFTLKTALTVTRTPVSLRITSDVSAVTRVRASVVQSFTRAPIALPIRLVCAAISIPQFAVSATNALPVLGSAITTSAPSGWTQIFNANNDDTPVASGTFPFSFPFNGTLYTSCFISPNGYITFGSGSSAYSSLSASNPALPKIFLNAMDDSVQRIYTRSTANTFRIRYEGNTNSSGTGTSYRTFEIAFFDPGAVYGMPAFEVRMGLSPDNTGLFNAYSASAILSEYTVTPAANNSWVFFGANETGTAWVPVGNYQLLPVE